MPGAQIFGLVTVGGTLAIAVVCFVLYAVLHRKRHYRCPKCGGRFKTSAAATFTAARDGVDKRLVCPHCGHFGFMEDHRDSERDQDGPPDRTASSTEEPKAPARDDRSSRWLSQYSTPYTVIKNRRKTLLCLNCPGENPRPDAGVCPHHD